MKCLLMGGQACVLYGGAEFSRDTDLAILADVENLARLRAALADLRAECIAVPPFELRYLEMGLAIHFRCVHPDAMGMRVDVMSKMRGVDAFPELWNRRTTIEVDNESLELLSLPDLVRSKKTQRDKDWPMIARLVEANYFANCHAPSDEQIIFWLSECRTATLLADLIKTFPAQAKSVSASRPLLGLAKVDLTNLDTLLREEELDERQKDRVYWAPLRQELERLRADRRSRG